MRNAPSVIYPVGRCAFWALLLGCLGVLLAGALAWGWEGLSRWQVGCLGLAVLAWWLGAARSVARHPRGWLRFRAASLTPVPGDAAWVWLVEPGGDARPLTTPRVVLDLQQRVLLQVGGAADVPRWVWLEAASSPGDWLALRRALLVNAAR
jgi:hypothetical protein